jgi:hypothetical protein
MSLSVLHVLHSRYERIHCPHCNGYVTCAVMHLRCLSYCVGMTITLRRRSGASVNIFHTDLDPTSPKRNLLGFNAFIIMELCN